MSEENKPTQGHFLNGLTMPSLFKSIPLVTILFVYILMCSMLYLKAFWGTFNIDFLGLISIMDISKYFLYTFLAVLIPLLIEIICGSPMTNIYKNEDGSIEWRIAFVYIVIIFTILYYIFFIDDYFYDAGFVFLSSFTIASGLMHFFAHNPIVKRYVTSRIQRTFLSYIIIFFPIVSYGMGKSKSVSIYKNVQSEYVHIDSDTTEYKFIGFIGDQMMYGMADNSKIYSMNRGSYKNISISTKRINKVKRKIKKMNAAEVLKYCMGKTENNEFFKWSIGVTSLENVLPIGKDWHIWACNSFEEADKLRMYLILNYQMDNYTPHPNGDETFIYVSKIR